MSESNKKKNWITRALSVLPIRPISDIVVTYILPTVSASLLAVYVYLRHWFSQALRVPIISTESQLNTIGIFAVVILAIPFLLLAFTFGYRAYFNQHIKRTFRFFPASDFLWKFIRQSEEVELLPYCPDHKAQFVVKNNPQRVECPRCSKNRELYSVADEWMREARAVAHSLGVSWKYNH